MPEPKPKILTPQEEELINDLMGDITIAKDAGDSPETIKNRLKGFGVEDHVLEAIFERIGAGSGTPPTPPITPTAPTGKKKESKEEKKAKSTAEALEIKRIQEENTLAQQKRNQELKEELDRELAELRGKYATSIKAAQAAKKAAADFGRKSPLNDEYFKKEDEVIENKKAYEAAREAYLEKLIAQKREELTETGPLIEKTAEFTTFMSTEIYDRADMENNLLTQAKHSEDGAFKKGYKAFMGWYTSDDKELGKKNALAWTGKKLAKLGVTFGVSTVVLFAAGSVGIGAGVGGVGVWGWGLTRSAATSFGLTAFTKPVLRKLNQGLDAILNKYNEDEKARAKFTEGLVYDKLGTIQTNFEKASKIKRNARWAKNIVKGGLMGAAAFGVSYVAQTELKAFGIGTEQEIEKAQLWNREHGLPTAEVARTIEGKLSDDYPGDYREQTGDRGIGRNDIAEPDKNIIQRSNWLGRLVQKINPFDREQSQMIRGGSGAPITEPAGYIQPGYTPQTEYTTVPTPETHHTDLKGGQAVTQTEIIPENTNTDDNLIDRRFDKIRDQFGWHQSQMIRGGSGAPIEGKVQIPGTGIRVPTSWVEKFFGDGDKDVSDSHETTEQGAVDPIHTEGEKTDNPSGNQAEKGETKEVVGETKTETTEAAEKAAAAVQEAERLAELAKEGLSGHEIKVQMHLVLGENGVSQYGQHALQALALDGMALPDSGPEPADIDESINIADNMAELGQGRDVAGFKAADYKDVFKVDWKTGQIDILKPEEFNELRSELIKHAGAIDLKEVEKFSQLQSEETILKIVHADGMHEVVDADGNTVETGIEGHPDVTAEEIHEMREDAKTVPEKAPADEINTEQSKPKVSSKGTPQKDPEKAFDEPIEKGAQKTDGTQTSETSAAKVDTRLQNLEGMTKSQVDALIGEGKLESPDRLTSGSIAMLINADKYFTDDELWSLIENKQLPPLEDLDTDRLNELKEIAAHRDLISFAAAENESFPEKQVEGWEKDLKKLTASDYVKNHEAADSSSAAAAHIEKVVGTKTLETFASNAPNDSMWDALKKIMERVTLPKSVRQ